MFNFAKPLEAMLHNHIYSVFKIYISPDQHGFMEKRSCMTNLTCIAASSLDNQKQVDVIYFDFKKIFDQIDHALLSKLDHIEFSENL